MQKKYPLLIFTTLFLLMLITGCAARRMAKQAVEYERAGMFKEAAELYYEASQRKPRNIDYKTGLKRTGQVHVDEVVTGMTTASSRGDYRKVVYDYLAMQEFTSKLNRAGVQIDINHSATSMYDDARVRYLDQRYDEGLQFISQESYDRAKGVFSEIFDIDPDFRDTRTYLNTATLEPLYQRGAEFFNQREFMAAYGEWEKVALSDPGYKDVRSRMDQALSERYKEGTMLLLNEEFSAAALALADVFRVNPDYDDVRELFTEARNEPLYRQALNELDAGNCRQAYWILGDVLEDTGGNYKDARNLRSQSLECARYAIAVHRGIMPNHPSDGEEFENVMIQQILELEDPFLIIHRLPLISSRIHRSFLRASGSLNRTHLRELRQRNDIDAVLVLNFARYSKMEGELERIRKTGFERKTITTEDGELKQQDRQVSYNEYQKENQVTLTMNIQLVSTRNGEILISRRFRSTMQDEMHYADYNGEAKKLYPARRTDRQYVIDERNYKSLQTLLAAGNTIESPEKLRDRLFLELSDEIVFALANFNPEK